MHLELLEIQHSPSSRRGAIQLCNKYYYRLLTSGSHRVNNDHGSYLLRALGGLLEKGPKKQLANITGEEHEGLKLWPYSLVAPMLTQNICRVGGSIFHVVKGKPSRRHSFMNSVEGQKVVSLIKFSMQ